MAITFKQFLSESPDEWTKVSSLSVDEIINLLEKNCKNSMKTKIFRGFPGNYRVYTGDSSGAPRESANTENYYTLFVDNSPAWKDYPKRSQGFVGTNSIEIAETYGACYYMVPYDNAKIGVCPESDFWDCFDLNGLTMGTFQRLVSRMLQRLGKNHKPKNFEEMKQIFQEFTLDLIPAEDTQLFRLMEYYGSANLFELYADIFKPKDFQHFTGSTLKLDDHTQEVWVEGKVIFIPIILKYYQKDGSDKKYTKYDKLLNYLQNQQTK